MIFLETPVTNGTFCVIFRHFRIQSSQKAKFYLTLIFQYVFKIGKLQKTFFFNFPLDLHPHSGLQFSTL